MYRMRSLHLLRPRCALAWHADELAHKHTSKKSCELVGGGHVSAHISRRIHRRVAVDQPDGLVRQLTPCEGFIIGLVCRRETRRAAEYRHFGIVRTPRHAKRRRRVPSPSFRKAKTHA